MGEGILDIRVSKSTLVNLGYTGGDTGDATEEEITKVKADVSRSVGAILASYRNDCEVMYSSDPPMGEAGNIKSRYKDSAIVVDVDEKALGPRKFEKFIIECGDAALKTILKYKK